MFIVPYFIRKPLESTDFKVSTLWIFLSGGKTVWETDEAKCSEKFMIDNYLTPNGLLGKVHKTTKTTLFFELDERTQIDNFYTWTEFLKTNSEIPAVDIFRPFVWLGNSKLGEKDEWGWYEECEQISLGKFGSLIDIWTGVSKV